jgi:hypothetical protein
VVAQKKVVSTALKKATPLTKALTMNGITASGSWWVWLCLIDVCVLVVCICSAYSDEKGTLPMATMRIQQIAGVLAFGSSVCSNRGSVSQVDEALKCIMK